MSGRQVQDGHHPDLDYGELGRGPTPVGDNEPNSLGYRGSVPLDRTRVACRFEDGRADPPAEALAAPARIQAPRSTLYRVISSEEGRKRWSRTVSLDWEKVGEAWLRQVVERARQLEPEFAGFGATKTLAVGEPVTVVLSRHDGSYSDEGLVIRGLPGQLVEVWVDTEGEPDQRYVDMWANAVASIDPADIRTLEHAWSAVIGPVPGIGLLAGQGAIAPLETPETVGGLHLTPGNVAFEETVRQGYSFYGGFAMGTSWPVIVQGTSQGSDSIDAMRPACEQLHRLCGLASLGLPWATPPGIPQCWVLRAGPRPLDQGLEQIPSRSLFHLPQPHDPEPVVTPPGFTLPQWFETAWHRLGEEPRLQMALGSYHEALLLHKEHPSFALIALTAAIEAIGSRLYQAPICDSCHQIMKSTARFRQTLRLVLPDDQVRLLARSYGQRSRTAHEGTLHGLETMSGYVFMSDVLATDPRQVFAVEMMVKMINVVRHLLLIVLTHPHSFVASPEPLPDNA